jgi:hypothetical protein
MLTYVQQGKEGAVMLRHSPIWPCAADSWLPPLLLLLLCGLLLLRLLLLSAECCARCPGVEEHMGQRGVEPRAKALSPEIGAAASAGGMAQLLSRMGTTHTYTRDRCTCPAPALA